MLSVLCLHHQHQTCGFMFVDWPSVQRCPWPHSSQSLLLPADTYKSMSDFVTAVCNSPKLSLWVRVDINRDFFNKMI